VDSSLHQFTLPTGFLGIVYSFTINKSAGTYAGGGYWFIIVEGYLMS